MEVAPLVHLYAKTLTAFDQQARLTLQLPIGAESGPVDTRLARPEDFNLTLAIEREMRRLSFICLLRKNRRANLDGGGVVQSGLSK